MNESIEVLETHESAQTKLDPESAAGVVRIWWNRADFLGRRSPSHLPEQNAISVSSRLVLTLVARPALD